MTIDPNTLDLSELLDGITLAGGLHDEATAVAEHRMCVMEATGWLAGEPWSDHPACVSRALGAIEAPMNTPTPTAGEV